MSAHYLGPLNQSNTPRWPWILSPLISRADWLTAELAGSEEPLGGGQHHSSLL